MVCECEMNSWNNSFIVGLFFISVCTCVVHKRCHQSIVTKCPGSKEVVENEGAVGVSIFTNIR